MFDFVQDVFLSHELRKLVRGEKFFDTSLERALVDDMNRHRSINIDYRHTILDISLDLHHTCTDLLLENLSDKPHTSLTEVIDIICVSVRSIIQIDDVSDNNCKVFF